MLLNDVRTRLRSALTTTIVEEYSLFLAGTRQMPPSERAFAAQLAFRLRNAFEDHWDVDVEYNRALQEGIVDAKRTGPTARELGRRLRQSRVPRTADLIVHRRGRTGQDNNLLLLELKMLGTGHHAHENQRLSDMKAIYQYRHAAILDLHLTYNTGHDEIPASVSPTWLWSGIEAERDPNVYEPHVALAICRRGHQRSPLSFQVGPIAQIERRAEILPQLKARYGQWIRPDITSVAVLQHEDAALLEIAHTWADRPDHKSIELVDLAVAGFDAADPIEANAVKFLHLDELDLINVTPLFNEDDAQAIADSYLREEEFADRL